LTWDELGAQLAAQGVNRLRVKFNGWNGPLGTKALSFEPRYGEFNDWGGRLQQFVQMCRDHDVQIHALPFDNAEWVRDDAWSQHAWNRDNGGFLLDRRDGIDARAYSAAEARIDAMFAYAGDVIGAVELCAEMTWMINPGFWGVSDWDAMDGPVYNVAVPWVEHMAQYVGDRYGVPVGNGHLHAPNGFSDTAILRNEISRVPWLDFSVLNWYGTNSVKSKLRYLRECQQYAEHPCYVTQYAPWALNQGAAYTPEDADFSKSKEHEWAAACGEFGFTGPMRWPEIRPVGQVAQWWGVAHPNMAAIAGITSQMAEYVDLSKWANWGESWDGWINGATDYTASWCDRSHLQAFIAWDGSNDTDLEVEGLDDGDYTAYWFDWLDGDLMTTYVARSAGGLLTLPDAPDRADHSALYLERQDVTPPQATRVTLRLIGSGGQQAEMTVEAGKTYTLEVEEVS